MSRIFLSYARDDVDAAAQLADFMSEAGHEVWWDRHLSGGARFAKEIEKALKNAEAVVVIWSEASVDSAWVQDEAEEGRDSGRLIPVAIGAAKPPLGFRQFHVIDLGSWSGGGRPEAVDELLDAIGRTCASADREQAPASAKTERTHRKISICVLPFANMSGDPQQDYFSDGISEDITTDLSKISALEVVARNPTLGFKWHGGPGVKEIAKQLCVSHVLEGSVRKAGNRIRINAQLIDGSTGKHLWADRFDRDLTNVFEIQDEISKSIVDALQLRLLPQERKAIEGRGTANVEAYNLYLMARQQWSRGGFSDPARHRIIVRLCREATNIDPTYAQAWALMALAQACLRFWHGTEDNALPAAERAMELDPTIPEPRCVKGRHLEEEGKPEEAERQIRSAVELAPQSWEANRELAAFLYRRGRRHEAITFFEKAASIMKTDTSSAGMLISCYRATGDAEKLREAAQMCVSRAERAIAHDPSHAEELAWGTTALAVLGEGARARDWARRALLIEPGNQGMRYNLACAFTFGLDDRESALEILAPYFDRADSQAQLRHMDTDSDLDSLRDDPRFKAMLASAKNRLHMGKAAN